ncbi:hypothetical protein OS493_013245 [Desmophyllum pertusum]|uniref:Uncharacterized protein n=1 Tax=Desmophyllum pertusum TaxID=174260 RepID=A0A9X0CMP5_9CNID|nr:hypothetical protein OS493_013245 [Desmophyllum pertusum]
MEKPITGETEAESKGQNRIKEAEKQDMAALEVLLAKAQKAREIQTKMDEAAAKANQKKKISKKPLPVTTKQPLKQPVQHVAKQSLPKAAKPASKQPAPVRKLAPQKPAIKSTYSSSYGRPSSAKALMRPSGSRGSAKMYLDSVLKKGTHSKTISREQGHIPSRTGAGPSGKVTELQRSTTLASVTRKEKDNDTRTHSEQSCHDSQIALSSERDSPASDELLRKLTVSTNPLIVLENSKRVSYKSTMRNSVTGIPHQSSGLGNLDSQSKTEERNIFQECKKETLDPFAVDAEFVLPGKYRKLKSTSTGLYSELRKIIEKDGKPSPCQHFVECLEAGFDVGNISTRNEIQGKANGLLEEHEQLSTLTDAVVTRSCSLRDDASWQEIYKCYRHWQIVLSKFNELQRRTQKLLEGE